MLKNWGTSRSKNNLEQPKATVISVKELFTGKELRIPEYQRPYKWEVRHVNQFINDLLQHAEKDNYRIGNMVVHVNEEKEEDELDIVDGQQRFVTLLLMLKAIKDFRDHSLNGVGVDFSTYLRGNALNFTNPISKQNIYDNFQAIKQQAADLYRIRNFILTRVELVQFVLHDQSEAFQFFDSQNARGRELYPHDLLKAFHLREFPAEEEHYKVDVVEVWEDMESEQLAELFERYLYRVRTWSKGQHAWYFSKNEIDWFKGINIDSAESYPFINTLRLMHNRIDDIAKDMPTYIGSRKYIFPFQLDQHIINGRRFFEMISVYKSLIDTVTNKNLADHIELDTGAQEIIESINSYDGHSRTGDQYVRSLFYAALIYYVDRFGMQGLSDAIKKLFVWSYRKRLEMFAVRVETIANHAHRGFYEQDYSNAFRVIGDAIDHTEIRKLNNPPIDNIKRDKMSELIDLMNSLNIQIKGEKNE